MKRVKQFIQEHTKKCGNVCSYNSIECEIPWLTPDDTRMVAQIARKETIEEVCEWLRTNMVQYMEYCHNGTGESVEEFTEDLKKHFSDK